MPTCVIALSMMSALFFTQGAVTETPRERYQALVKEYDTELMAWEARYGAGAFKDPEALLEARYRDWPGWLYAGRFLELAQAHLEDPAAIDALLWITNLSFAVGVSDQLLVVPYTRAWISWRNARCSTTAA